MNRLHIESRSLAALLAEIQKRAPCTIPSGLEDDLKDPLATLSRQITSSLGTAESTALSELLWWIARNPEASSVRAINPAVFSPDTLHLLTAFISDFLSGRYAEKEVVARISSVRSPSG